MKTGQDPQASQVDLGSVTPTTVGYLTSLPAQPSLPDNSRLAPTELTQYEITGTIVDIALQHDNDYHVVIQDNSSSNVMITEIPDPACVPSSSPFASMIANARSEITANGAVGATVAIKGVGFFDSNTLTSNVAPNKIELHPVLDFNFNPGTPPPTNYFTVSSSPSSTSDAGTERHDLGQHPGHQRLVAERHPECERPSPRGPPLRSAPTRSTPAKARP